MKGISNSFFSSLIFLAAAQLVTQFQGKRIGLTKWGTWSTLLIILSLFGAKLAYDRQISVYSPSLYATLEVTRLHSASDIRHSYKRLSMKYHPDKVSPFSSDEAFYRVKFAYDVLMDPTSRDIYNRFGEDSLSFDPRNDELRLIANIVSKYLFWGVCVFVATFRQEARSSRTWLVVVGAVLLAIEFSLALTELSLPFWMPFDFAEFEIVSLFHQLYPGVIAALGWLAEASFVDKDKVTAVLLQQIRDQQQVVLQLTSAMEKIATVEVDSSGNAEEMSERILSLREAVSQIEQSLKSEDEVIDVALGTLKQLSVNYWSNYYWIIFIVLYAGIYMI